MKKIIIAFLATAALFACKKDINSCKKYTEMTDEGKLVDLNTISDPAILDTLNKYPQLKLVGIHSDSFGWQATCNVYYNGLINFSGQYKLNKSNVTGLVNCNDTSILKTVPLGLSTNPMVTVEDAVMEAKKHINLDHTCIYYRLGIFSVSYDKKNYKLVWKIQGKNSYPYVIMDANNKHVYQRTGPIYASLIE